MKPRFTVPLVLAVIAGVFAGHLAAQIPDARLFPGGAVDPDESKIIEAIDELRESGGLLDVPAVMSQLERKTCQLELLPVADKKLAGREIWQVARRSHLRLGWYRLCTTCDQWHLKLGGGYVISADGAVATCEHLIRPEEDTTREGYLLAADDDGRVYPVTEVLASNRRADVAIVRVKAEGLTPLALNTAIAPGDSVWCYSEPLGQRGYFSQGIVNRFFHRGRQRSANGPVVISVSADWAPGSSGSAVLDECGNAVGHVSRISSFMEGGGESLRGRGLYLVIREAASARDLLRLIDPAGEAGTHASVANDQ